MNKLLILSNSAEEYARELGKRALPDLEIFIYDGTDSSESLIRAANIILGQPALVSEILERAEQLEWVQSSFAGIEPLCQPGLRTDYTLTGVKGVFGPLMSEYVFAYILALERNIFAMRANQKKSVWGEMPYRSLGGLTIGICGLGSIGRHIASTASYFNMKVLGLSRSAAQTPSVEMVFGLSEIDEFVSQLDYLVVVLPSTPETKGIISEAVLKNMRRSAVLINVGRGAAVDESALANALGEGRLRAAVLDVFNKEPLPEESPFWKLENAYVTPHNSAFTFPKEIVEIFCDNYRRYRSGKPLKFKIDFDRGY
jgi:phosphoglycerate dehydrogenase-like enzyme